MPHPASWRFGPFVLDRTTRELSRSGQRVHLANRPFDVLDYLIAERHRLVSRSELLEQFWSGGHVYEEALTRCVSSIRKALDDRDNPPSYLETRWNVGYRFIGEVAADLEPATTHGVATDATVAEAGSPAPPARASMASPARARWLAAAAMAVLASGAWLLADRAIQPESLPQIRRLAVLPLEVSGVDPQLVEGLDDELLRAVSRIEGLRVIARGSVLRTTADRQDPVAIGRALRVQALLTGRLRQDAEHAVVAVRLIDAADAAVLWSYDARVESRDFARSPDTVAARLATHLSARLRSVPASSVSLKPDNYARYLRARHYWNQRTGGSLREAIRLYDRVIVEEPGFAEAHEGLAEAWLLMPLYAGVAPYVAHPKARQAAEAALRINPESSRAHAVLGVVKSQFEWNWRAADEHFLRAISLDPNNATAYQWRAESFCYRRLLERCQSDLREALALDPLSPIIETAQGLPARFAGDLPRARERFATTLRKYPSFAFAEFQLALIDSAEGRWQDAIARYERVLPAMGPILGGAPLGYAYARAGRKDDARRILDDLRRLSTVQYVPPVAFSDVAIGLGDRVLALAWLERALAVRDDFLTQVGVDHHHRELHGDPRFRAIMARVGTPLPNDADPVGGH